MSRTGSKPDDFDAQTQREGECLRWVGRSFGPDGFGVYQDGETRILAHRYAFERAHGRKPAGVVNQTCRNKWCVAEAHLVEGPYTGY